MKLTSSILATLLLSITLAASGAEKDSAKPKSSLPEKSTKTAKSEAKSQTHREVVIVTGSHLNRNVHHDGLVSDGPNLVYILDSETIANSGASTIHELLTRKGAAR